MSKPIWFVLVMEHHHTGLSHYMYTRFQDLFRALEDRVDLFRISTTSEAFGYGLRTFPWSREDRRAEVLILLGGISTGLSRVERTQVHDAMARCPIETLLVLTPGGYCVHDTYDLHDHDGCRVSRTMEEAIDAGIMDREGL